MIEDEKKVTHIEWNSHELNINALLDDVREMKKVDKNFEKRLRAVEDSMIKLPQIIQEAITESVRPLSQENKDLNSQVSELRTEKYRMAYGILKWVLITAGGVVVTYVIGLLINNLWG